MPISGIGSDSLDGGECRKKRSTSKNTAWESFVLKWVGSGGATAKETNRERRLERKG